MRLRSNAFAVLWLAMLTQCAQSKPRFGMLFQMNKQGEKVVSSDAASDKVADESMAPICVDQVVLQAQLDHAKTRLLEKEQEASQIQAKLAKQMEELQQKLVEAETDLQKPKTPIITNNSKAPPSDATSPVDVESMLAEQRLELEAAFKADIQELEERLKQAHSALEESNTIATDLQAQLDTHATHLEDIQSQHDEELSEWKLAKQDLLEKANLLDKALQEATDDKSSSEKLSQKSKEDAAYWETAFRHRAYVNVTHLAEFTEVLVTAVTAPVIETVRGTYHAYVKDGWDKAMEIGQSAYQKNLSPLYDAHVAPLYEEHAATLVATGREKIAGAWNEIPSAVSKGWTVALDLLVGGVESTCKASLELIESSERRSKVQIMCDDARPFVVTLLSLPVIMLLGRLLFWFLLLPIKLLLLLSPVRFSELGIQSEQTESVSASDPKPS